MAAAVFAKAAAAKSCYYTHDNNTHDNNAPVILPERAMSAPTPELILYSTPACHLCVTAYALISPYLTRRDIPLQEVDISTSDALIDRYGIRIPVLRFSDSEEELGWPFSEAQFLTFIDRVVERDR